MTTNVNWEKILVDEPIKVILLKFKKKIVDLDEAAKGMNCFGKVARLIAKSKKSSLQEQKLWKNSYLCNSVLDTLHSQKGGYKAMVAISEKSKSLTGVLDQIENDYGGKRMTLKRITDPDRALAAEKLLKARVAHRKKLAQTP